MNDNELVRLLKTDPEQGLAAAVEQYTGLVKAVVRPLVGERRQQDIEECIADVFLRFYQSIERFDPAAGSLKGYLCGVARYTALDYRRRLTKGEPLLSIEENEVGVAVDPADSIAAAANIRIVQESIAAMEPPDKEIFVMRYFFGIRVADIAGRLGLENKAVENRLYRGRKKLKNELLERGVIL